MSSDQSLKMRREVSELLASVGITEDFFWSLGDESDWSLVIKMHALFEAVVGRLVVGRLNKPGLEDVVSNLEFNNMKSGKVAFARALGLLESEDVAFLRGLSELRNRLVHDIRNVNFSIADDISNKNASELKKFRKEFGWTITQLKNGEEEYERLLKSTPKWIVFLAGYVCLLRLQFRVSDHDRNRIVDALVKASHHGGILMPGANTAEKGKAS